MSEGHEQKKYQRKLVNPESPKRKFQKTHLGHELRTFINVAFLLFGCETKPPISESDQTADFENGTKSPILIMRQNRRF